MKSKVVHHASPRLYDDGLSHAIWLLAEAGLFCFFLLVFLVPLFVILFVLVIVLLPLLWLLCTYLRPYLRPRN